MRIAEGTEITSIDTRIRSGRLKVAVATRDRVVARIDCTRDQVWEMFAIKLQKTVARAIAFAGDSDDKLMLLGMFDGMLHKVCIEDGKISLKDSRMICRLV
jgi:hypothetical protein